MIKNQSDKFMKLGQVLDHKPTGSRWIVVDTNPYEEKDNGMNYTRLVKAYCLFTGNKRDYWEVNQLDDWIVTNEDLAEHDKIWTIIQCVTS